jgi:hypothetical protein
VAEIKIKTKNNRLLLSFIIDLLSNYLLRKNISLFLSGQLNRKHKAKFYKNFTSDLAKTTENTYNYLAHSFLIIKPKYFYGKK